LNELPLELIEDLSEGPSWLSYARGTGEKRYAASAGDWDDYPRAPKSKNVYTGKTYNSADAIAEFFNKKGIGNKPKETGSGESPRPSSASAFDRLKAAGTGKPAASSSSDSGSGFIPGSHVKHEKYGRGLVLRREGSGDNVKLTISFPGFGQKKLIEKYANLEKA
jgi:DNA helicase-2/ATP-dependent DNA helicase PcrA